MAVGKPAEPLRTGRFCPYPWKVAQIHCVSQYFMSKGIFSYQVKDSSELSFIAVRSLGSGSGTKHKTVFPLKRKCIRCAMLCMASIFPT